MLIQLFIPHNLFFTVFIFKLKIYLSWVIKTFESTKKKDDQIIIKYINYIKMLLNYLTFALIKDLFYHITIFFLFY